MSETGVSNTTPTDDDDWRKREVGLALTNAVKLGSSLILTWGIALVTRLYIPRYLGPERFGALNFADAFTGTAFVVMSLGLDTYVRKEISVRPGHANDFVGGIVTLRLALLVLVYGAMEVVLRVTRCSPDVRMLVYIYGASQFFAHGGNTSAGLLHATGKVGEMSVLSVVIKVIWAICVFLAIILKLGLWAFPATFAATEGIKSFVLYWLARKYLGFQFRVNIKATLAVLLAALPFFVSGLATTVYDKIGVSLLEFLSSRLEVGWFGAASGLSGVTLLFTPLLAWVVIPLFARSAAQSRDDLFKMVRRSLEFVLVAAIPVSTALFVGADIWVTLLFGQAFAPAAMALRVLSVATLLMYLSIVAVYALAVLNHTWSMSFIFLAGTIISPAANFILIPKLSATGVAGAAGAACALSTLVTELAMVTGLLWKLGKSTFDRHLIAVIAKSVAAALAVILLDAHVFRPWGPIRLLVDASIYVIAVGLSGAVDLRAFVALVKTAKQSRGAQS
jgi:O-antigen/teichoic acid export membrane protein